MTKKHHACTDCKLNNIEVDTIFKEWLNEKENN